jgi:hypothetical protein
VPATFNYGTDFDGTAALPPAAEALMSFAVPLGKAAAAPPSSVMSSRRFIQ